MMEIFKIFQRFIYTNYNHKKFEKVPMDKNVMRTKYTKSIKLCKAHQSVIEKISGK